MPQSLSQVILHVIFSTKDRERLIDAAIRPGLHAYLATIGRDQGAEVYRVGGAADHVHMVVTLPRTVTQAGLLEEVKKNSSRWVKEAGPRYTGFSWQRGYGAFSVSQSQLAAVIAYVDGQEEHHRKVTFQDEYRSFLRKHGVAFDERYVWD